MSKKVDNSNIAEVLTEMTGKKPDVKTEKEAFEYFMPTVEKLYNLLQPALTTVETNNLIFINSNELVSDNAYYLQLIDYYHNASPTFSNLIDLRRNMLIGNGLQPVNKTGDTYQLTLDFLNKENTFGQSLMDIWNLLCFDYSLFEQFYLEVLYSPKGKGVISEIIHHDTSTVRAVANKNINLPYPDSYQLSRNWGTTNKVGRYVQTATSGIPIAVWNPYSWAKDGARQLLTCKRYSSGNEVYAIPSFNSILAYVELDAQLAQYNLNSVSKGFTPTSIVVLAGNPDKKTKDEFVSKFKNKYVGANGEKVLFIWTTNAEEKPEIMPFNTVDNAPMIELLDKILTSKIASGMGANAELAGIQTQGNSLQSDMNKLSVSYNFYYMTHIKPMQQQMVQTLNKIMRLNGLMDLTVVTPPLQLEQPNPQQAPVQPQAVNQTPQVNQ